MQKRVGAAIAATILSTWGAPTFASTATAQLSDFQIQLIDLDTTDAIAPSITFQNVLGGSFAAAESGWPANVATDARAGGLLFGALSTASAHGPAMATATLSGDAFGRGANATASASTVLPGAYGASTVWLGDGQAYVPFTLSAGTRLVITADASASAMSTLDGAQADTWASVFLKLSDGTGVDGVSQDSVSAEQFGTQGATPFLQTDAHRIEISFENLASTSADGIFTGSIDAYSADLAPVPEPGGLALVLSGLGALAWRGRRRAR